MPMSGPRQRPYGGSVPIEFDEMVVVEDGRAKAVQILHPFLADTILHSSGISADDALRAVPFLLAEYEGEVLPVETVALLLRRFSGAEPDEAHAPLDVEGPGGAWRWAFGCRWELFRADGTLAAKVDSGRRDLPGRVRVEDGAFEEPGARLAVGAAFAKLAAERGVGIENHYGSAWVGGRHLAAVPPSVKIEGFGLHFVRREGSGDGDLISVDPDGKAWVVASLDAEDHFIDIQSWPVSTRHGNAELVDLIGSLDPAGRMRSNSSLRIGEPGADARGGFGKVFHGVWRDPETERLSAAREDAAPRIFAAGGLTHERHGDIVVGRQDGMAVPDIEGKFQDGTFVPAPGADFLEARTQKKRPTLAERISEALG